MKIKTATGRKLHEFYEWALAKDYEFVPDDLNGSCVVKDGVFILELDAEYDVQNLGSVLMDGEEYEHDVGVVFNEWTEEQRLADPRRKSPRYPYTYAADAVRNFAKTEHFLSRGDAAQVYKAIAKSIDMPDHEMAERLADYYLEHENELVDASMDRISKLDPRDQ